ncbi:MAG: hypothetical protein PVSMB1_08000 [Gemmatimonadaceae bacterium]
MAVFYLDTSAILKRYRTEKGTDVVNELYEHRPVVGNFLTSHFSCLEVESVAARTLKGKLLSQEAYNALLGSFSRDLSDHLHVVETSGDVINAAIDAARKYALRAADAVQFASAPKRGTGSFFSRRKEFTFVTSDKELLAAAEAAGISTLDPEAEGAIEELRKSRSSG